MERPSALGRVWHNFPLKTGHSWLNCLLVFVPASLILYLLHLSPLLIFAATALAIAPMAGVLGEGTSPLAAYAGPAAGGVLHARFGNATEVIISPVALPD